MKRLRVNTSNSSTTSVAVSGGGGGRVYVDDPQSPPEDDIPLGLQQRPGNLGRWLEAAILPGDTLQAISLRFNCSIPELKKLNKIDKDNEIFARRVVRVPITAHSMLLDALPPVHAGTDGSPQNVAHRATVTTPGQGTELLPTVPGTDEQLIVAAVSNASYRSVADTATTTTTTTGAKSSNGGYYTESLPTDRVPLLPLSGIYDDNQPQPRPVRLPTNDFSCNGSDCDISWICLLVCILALCFAIPLIYVIYVAEHIEKYHHDSFNVSPPQHHGGAGKL